MNEILISLGGILLVQLGLSIRKWISEKHDRQSNSDIRKELLNLIADLKSETTIFKDQIKDFTKEIKRLKDENLDLMKRYNVLKQKLENIEGYAKFSKDLKTFEFEKTSHALSLISDKNSKKKLNPALRSFLETGAKALIRIMYKTLSHGLENVNIEVIESDFKESEYCLRNIFSCVEMNANKEDVENIIYTEKGKFLTQLRKVTDDITGIKDKDKLRDVYLMICDKLLENIIIEIKNL